MEKFKVFGDGFVNLVLAFGEFFKISKNSVKYCLPGGHDQNVGLKALMFILGIRNLILR